VRFRKALAVCCTWSWSRLCCPGPLLQSTSWVGCAGTTSWWRWTTACLRRCCGQRGPPKPTAPGAPPCASAAPLPPRGRRAGSLSAAVSTAGCRERHVCPSHAPAPPPHDQNPIPGGRDEQPRRPGAPEQSRAPPPGRYSPRMATLAAFAPYCGRAAISRKGGSAVSPTPMSGHSLPPILLLLPSLAPRSQCFHQQ